MTVESKNKCPPPASPTITGATPIEMLPRGLNTSGLVEGAPYVEMPDGQKFLAVGWAMLSPFAQGYVEAMFSGARDWPGKTFAAFNARGMRPLGFRDLAPEALATILRDCKAMQGAGLAGTADVGRSAWSARQGGLCVPDFPPLGVYLNGAGKVALTSQSSGEGQ